MMMGGTSGYQLISSLEDLVISNQCIDWTMCTTTQDSTLGWRVTNEEPLWPASYWRRAQGRQCTVAVQPPIEERCQPKVEPAMTRPLCCHEESEWSGLSHPAWTKTEPKVLHRNRLWTYSEKQSPTWHLRQSKQAPAQAISREQSPVSTMEESDQDEEITEGATQEVPLTLLRSGRAHRPPALYDPSKYRVEVWWTSMYLCEH